jgi:chaperone required for assembly of F1-ATPase
MALSGQAAAKRFYDHAGAEPAGNGAWTVVLDGRPVKTPRGRTLTLPNHALTVAVALEWDEQTDAIRPDSMPLTQLAVTALDRMEADRAEVVASLAAYATTDLVCHRATGPEELVLREEAQWQPLLDWAEEAFDARLTVTTGVLPVEQPAEAVEALCAAVAELDAFELAVLGTVTPASGSLIIGLAFVAGRLDVDGVLEAAFVEETYQAEQWGEDAEAAARHDAIADDIAAAGDFLAYLRGQAD